MVASLPQTKESYMITSCVDSWVYKMNGRTKELYKTLITSFRSFLLEKGYEVNAAPEIIAPFISEWAVICEGGRDASPATYQNRVSVLSSFYHFALENYKIFIGNPTLLVDDKISAFGRHRRSKGYALQAEEIRERLQAIDRSNFYGLRDYALLVIALMTGRRLSELGNLRWGDISISEEKATITWSCKGGIISIDTLPISVTSILMKYLRHIYGEGLSDIADDKPIWISSKRNKGGAVTVRTIANIFEKHLGVGKVQTTRHTMITVSRRSGLEILDADTSANNDDLEIARRFVECLDKQP